ncbi:uncharacterized protein LOC142327329 [Lycorma delicatula]|uniref:uncharacterized protein LOC142327329 n=1 Tax=Lycorma delicatula TaxID=130591 RepID=UPI003F51A320
MARNKMIKKNCTFCGLQVAVACKTCPGCKHSFHSSKRGTAENVVVTSSLDSTSGSRRRTERVKREKPNYYDASEYEKKTKKKRLERGQYQGRERGRPPNPHNLKKKKKKTKTPKESEDDVTTVLSPEKTLQCSIILAELNRKFISTTWRG